LARLRERIRAAPAKALRRLEMFAALFSADPSTIQREQADTDSSPGEWHGDGKRLR